MAKNGLGSKATGLQSRLKRPVGLHKNKIATYFLKSGIRNVMVNKACKVKGIWKTMHCRLCLNCYGAPPPPPPTNTDTHQPGSVTINAKTTMYCSPDSSMLQKIDAINLKNDYFSFRFLLIKG